MIYIIVNILNNIYIIIDIYLFDDIEWYVIEWKEWNQNKILKLCNYSINEISISKYEIYSIFSK